MDASEQSIGAVLSQKQGGEKLIAYASCTYSRAEQNYCTTRKELLAVVYFMKHFQQYLLGNCFFDQHGPRRLNVVAEGNRLDGPARVLARAPSGIRLQHRTPSRAQARKVVATTVRAGSEGSVE